MGKPAARMGDMTAHGGSIVLGLPTVLIGGMPAARVGDMHVCPMMTPGVPPIPHVGGPVSLGSVGVLIGGMPGARVGDMLTCVGPPDTIAMGCMTVLIGDLSPGGGGGGGAGSSGASSASASAKTALSDNVEATTKEKNWVEFEIVDKAGNPVSGIPYKFTDTNDKDSHSNIRTDGKIRRDTLKEGECKVQLFYVSNAKWSKDKVDIGDKVKLSAKVEGYEDGTPATFEVYSRDFKRTDYIVFTSEAKVKSKKVETEWEFKYTDEEDGDPDGAEVNNKYSSPVFYFRVIVEHCTAQSGLLMYKDYIEIELLDDDDKPIGNEDYIIYLSDGSVRKGKLNGSGYKKEEKVPPGFYRIIFPNLKKVARET